MKVFGQLERAQIEVLAADPTGADLVIGRMWYRSDTDRFRVYDGAAVQEFVDLVAAQTLQNKILSSPTINTPTVSGASTYDELGSTPSNPAAGNHKLYYKNDGELYTLNSAGTEVALSGGDNILTYVTKTNNATLLDSETYVDVTTGALNISLTLPASPANGQRHVIRKADSGIGYVALLGTINGVVNFIMYEQYDTVEVIYNGTDWNLKNTERTEFVSAESATKTPTASSVWMQMTGNSVTLNPGVWIIHGTVYFSRSTDPAYTGFLPAWKAANGGDSASEPANISFADTPLPANGRLTIDVSTNVTEFSMTMPSFRVDSDISRTIYLVPYAGITTPANARVYTVIYAERVK